MWGRSRLAKWLWLWLLCIFNVTCAKKPRETTIFGFTSVVQIAKRLLHGFRLEAAFLGV
jgi:hypothetical protein